MKKLAWFFILFSIISYLGISIMGVGETAIGVSKVLSGSPGTFIYAKDAFYVFGWYSNSQYAFLLAKDTGEFIRNLDMIPGMNGQRIDMFTAIDFIRFLEGKGFKQVSPQELPPSLVATYGSWKYFLGLVGIPKLTVIFLPVGVVEDSLNLTRDS